MSSSLFSTSREPLVAWTEQGLYCKAGNFYIDPHRRVEIAVVTHAHSDHARRGSGRYICTSSSVGLMKTRLGKNIQVEGIPYQESFQLGDVRVSFHSAGHILGSAQIRIQRGDDVWVVSGDYKREFDPSCEPFEVVRCDTFITEATFGTPKYKWDKTREHGQDIYHWWKRNSNEGLNSILFGYSLGKTQRILAELALCADRPILVHESTVEITHCYREEGRHLAPTIELGKAIQAGQLQGELILAPPSILKSEWLEHFGEYRTAFASGWMQGSSSAHGSSYDYGFVLSDHADWVDLNQTIQETRATRVFVLHREEGALVRHLRKKGIDAHPVSSLTFENYQKIEPTNLSLF